MSGPRDRDQFLKWLGAHHPEMAPETRDKILEYGEAIAASHPRVGLVSRGDLSRIFMRHLRECLTPAILEIPPPGARLVDVGSGAGLPGIPFALLREDIEVWLVEPRERRAAFLERLALSLRLTRAHVFLGTLERVVREHPEHTWTLAVSRAVRWTPAMLDALQTRVGADGTILRFGAPVAPRPDVAVIPLDSESPRAIQIWPRDAWPDLPEAR